MKILAIDKMLPGTTRDRIMPHLKAEVKKAWDLYTSGVCRELYYRGDRSGAVLVLECASVEAARTVIDTLPLVKESLIDFDLIPLGPFASLSLLFADEAQPGSAAL